MTLRPVDRADLPALGEMLKRPEVAEWWPDYDAERLAKDIFAEPQEVTAFVIEFDRRPVGSIWYYEENEPEYRHAGIDLFVGADWQGRGIGTDALRTLAAHLFEAKGHHRIIIDPAASNERAVHVYKKVGFRPVGVMRRYERQSNGTFRDGLLMDMLPEDLT